MQAGATSSGRASLEPLGADERGEKDKAKELSGQLPQPAANGPSKHLDNMTVTDATAKRLEAHVLKTLKERSVEVKRETSRVAHDLALEEEEVRTIEQQMQLVLSRVEDTLLELKLFSSHSEQENSYTTHSLTPALIREMQALFKVEAHAGLQKLLHACERLEMKARSNFSQELEEDINDPGSIVCYVPVNFTGDVRPTRGDMQRSTFRMQESSTFFDLAHEVQNWLVDQPNTWELYAPELDKPWPKTWHIGHQLRKAAAPLEAIEVRKVPAERLAKQKAAEEATQRKLALMQAKMDREMAQKRMEQLQAELDPYVEKHRRTAHSTLLQLIFHAVYLVVLALDIGGRQKAGDNFELRQGIVNALRKPSIISDLGEQLDLSELKTIDQVWDWLQGPLVDALTQSIDFSTREQLLSTGTLALYNEVYGPLRLHQLRADAQPNNKLTAAAYGNASQQALEVLPITTDSGYSSAPFPPRFPGDPRVGAPGFVHSTNYTDKPYPRDDLDEFVSEVSHGQMDTYPPHGFIRDVQAAKDYRRVLQSLEQAAWIDHLTSAVIVKFSMRSINYPSSTSVKIYFEFPPSGLLETSLEVQTIGDEVFESASPGVAWMCNVVLLSAVVFLVVVQLRSLSAWFQGHISLFKLVCNLKFLLYFYIIATTIYKYSSIWKLNSAVDLLRERIKEAEGIWELLGVTSTGGFRAVTTTLQWEAEGRDVDALWSNYSNKEWPSEWPGDLEQYSTGYGDLTANARARHDMLALSCFTFLFVSFSALLSFKIFRRVAHLMDGLFGSGSRRMWVACSIFFVQNVVVWTLLLNACIFDNSNLADLSSSLVFVLRVLIGALDRESYDDLIEKYTYTAPLLLVLMTITLDILCASLLLASFYDGIAMIGEVERKIKKAQKRIKMLARREQLERESLKKNINPVNSLMDMALDGALMAYDWFTSVAKEQKANIQDDMAALKTAKHKISGRDSTVRITKQKLRARRVMQDGVWIDLLPWEVEEHRAAIKTKLKAGFHAVVASRQPLQAKPEGKSPRSKTRAFLKSLGIRPGAAENQAPPPASVDDGPGSAFSSLIALAKTAAEQAPKDTPTSALKKPLDIRPTAEDSPKSILKISGASSPFTSLKDRLSSKDKLQQLNVSTERDPEVDHDGSKIEGDSSASQTNARDSSARDSNARDSHARDSHARDSHARDSKGKKERRRSTWVFDPAQVRARRSMQMEQLDEDEMLEELNNLFNADEAHMEQEAEEREWVNEINKRPSNKAPSVFDTQRMNAEFRKVLSRKTVISEAQSKPF